MVSYCIVKTTSHTVTTDTVTIETTTSETTLIGRDYCQSTLKRDVHWPATPAGGVAIQPCPNNLQGQHWKPLFTT